MKLASCIMLLAPANALRPWALNNVGLKPRTASKRAAVDAEAPAADTVSPSAESISALTGSIKTVFNVEAVQKILWVEPVNHEGRQLDLRPHRYPFALVDKVIEYEAGKRAIGACARVRELAVAHAVAGQKRHIQRTSVHGPFPRSTDNAGRAAD